MKENRFRPWPISRRQFLGGILVGGAGLVLGCRPNYQRLLDEAEELTGPTSRRVWAFSDSHVGLSGKSNDDRDGGDWLQVCIDDLKAAGGEPTDYVLGLGDLTDDAGPADQLAAYAAVRDASGIAPWYEIAGNHDYAAVPAGRWKKYVKRPPRYAVIDGAAAWLFFSSEQGNSEGKVSRATANWLKGAIARYQDSRNIIVCSHQPVFGTVAGSDNPESTLNHRGLVRSILAEGRVDLWLCGHIHAGKRTARYIARDGRTTFINVSSAGHAYGTKAATGYLFEMSAGSDAMRARCRDHENRRDLPDQEVRLTLPHPWRFYREPVLVPAPV